MKNTLKKLSEDQRCKGVSAVRLRNKQVNFDKSTITVPNMSFQAVSSVDTYPPKKSVLGSQESELVASAFKNPQQKKYNLSFPVLKLFDIALQESTDVIVFEVVGIKY